MNGDLLQGVRVLDLTRLLPGPLCTQHLADLGAEVIKIEDVQGGDYGRYGLGVGGAADPSYFAAVNRGKRSLAVDLKAPAGRDLFMDLARSADLVIEGFRPGVMERLGLDYATLRQVNRRLVMCSLSGYGQSGPNRERAGHDLNYCAMTGLIDQTGEPGSAPVIPAFQIADLAGGTLTALSAVLAALYKAQRTGAGSYLDVAMADGVMAHMIFALAVQRAAPATGSARGEGALNGGLACYGVYPTADGRYLAVAALEPKFWERLCNALGRTDLIARQAVSGAAAQAQREELAALFRQRTLDEWMALLEPADCCVTPVQTFAAALDDPQFAARELCTFDAEGRVEGFGFPALIDGRRLHAEAPAPDCGGDSAAVLADLGYTDPQIEALVDAGVIRLG